MDSPKQSLSQWFIDNKEKARQGPDLFCIKMREKEYDDLTKLFKDMEEGRIVREGATP